MSRRLVRHISDPFVSYSVSQSSVRPSGMSIQYLHRAGPGFRQCSFTEIGGWRKAITGFGRDKTYGGLCRPQLVTAEGLRQTTETEKAIVKPAAGPYDITDAVTSVTYRDARYEKYRGTANSVRLFAMQISLEHIIVDFDYWDKVPHSPPSSLSSPPLLLISFLRSKTHLLAVIFTTKLQQILELRGHFPSSYTVKICPRAQMSFSTNNSNYFDVRCTGMSNCNQSINQSRLLNVWIHNWQVCRQFKPDR